MKKLKVSIQDENTLVLQEDGKQGDLIDLSSLHELDIDTSTISGVVKSIKKEAFEAEIKKMRDAIEREKELEIKLKEQELLEKIRILEKEKQSDVKLATAQEKTVSQADLAKK
ncbi:MAG: hypothetical protein WAU07_02035, partial [Microgenomates group bacterium]